MADLTRGAEAAAFPGSAAGAPRPALSIVVPTWNEEDSVTLLYENVHRVVEGMGLRWELLFVDDGSVDDTVKVLGRIRERDPRVLILELSRNFGHQIAITAGLDFATGEAVIVMDADLQDPPEVIPELLAKWNEGFQVVHAVRASRAGESRFKRWTARIFYRFLDRISDLKITLDAGDFRLLDRSVVLEMRRFREHHRFMRGLSSWVGYRQTEVLYDRASRIAGSTKYPVRKMLRLGANAVTSFSFVPLKIATYLGVLMSVLTLLTVVVVLVLRFGFGVGFLVGQTITLLAILLIGGVQLLSIGVIGEYLGRTYDEVRGRPLYLVSRAVGFVDVPPRGVEAHLGR